MRSVTRAIRSNLGGGHDRKIKTTVPSSPGLLGLKRRKKPTASDLSTGEEDLGEGRQVSRRHVSTKDLRVTYLDHWRKLFSPSLSLP